ncbi:unnamed protein product [Ectocarpus sp. 6 AP-2014]
MAATIDEVNRRGGRLHVQEGERRDKTAAAAVAPATHYSAQQAAKPRERHSRGWSSSPSNSSAAPAAALMPGGTTSLGLVALQGRLSMATSSSLSWSSSSSIRAPERTSSLAGVGDRHARRQGGDSMPIAGGTLDRHRGSPADTRQQHHVAATRRREPRVGDLGRISGDRAGSEVGASSINSSPPLRYSASVASGWASSVPDAGRRQRSVGRFDEVDGRNPGDYDDGDMRSSLARRGQHGGDGVNSSQQHATEQWTGMQSSSAAMRNAGQNRRRHDTTQISQRRRDDDEEGGAAERYQNRAENGIAATIADDARRSRPSSGVAPDQQRRDHRQNDIKRSGGRRRKRRDGRRTPAVTRDGIELAATFAPASSDTDEDHPRRGQEDDEAALHTAADVAAAAEAAVTAFVANHATGVAALPSHASRHSQQPEHQRQHSYRRRRRQHEQESPLSSFSWTTEVRSMPRPGRRSTSGHGANPDRGGGLPAAVAASGGVFGGSGVASSRPRISASGSTSTSDSAGPWQRQQGEAKIGVSGGGSSSIPRFPAAGLSAGASPEYRSRGRSSQSNISEYLSASAARGARVDDPSPGRASRFRSGPQTKIVAAASVFSRSGYSSHSRLGHTHSSSSGASSIPRAGSSTPRRSPRQTVLASSNSSSTGSALSDRMGLTSYVQPRSIYIGGGGGGGGGEGGGEAAHSTARNQHKRLDSARSETAATPPELTVPGYRSSGGDRPVRQGNRTSIGVPRILVRPISYGEIFGRVSPCDPPLQQHQRRASPLRNNGGEEGRGGQGQGQGRRQHSLLLPRASYSSSPPSSSVTLSPPSPSSLTPLSTPGGGGGEDGSGHGRFA